VTQLKKKHAAKIKGVPIVRATVWQRDQYDNGIKTDKGLYTIPFQILQKTLFLLFFKQKQTFF
jgi:hypothetical protein